MDIERMELAVNSQNIRVNVYLYPDSAQPDKEWFGMNVIQGTINGDDTFLVICDDDAKALHCIPKRDIMGIDVFTSDEE